MQNAEYKLRTERMFSLEGRRELMEKKKEVIATFDQDSKRYHRYIIDEGQEVVGTIYIPKGKEIPKEVTVKLRVKE